MFFQKLKIENINQTKQGETNIFLNQHAEYCVGRIAFILTGRQPNECVCVGALMHSEQVLTIFFLDLHISNLLNNIIFLCMYYVFFWKYTIARTLVSICALSLSEIVYIILILHPLLFICFVEREQNNLMEYASTFYSIGAIAHEKSYTYKIE